MGSAGVDSDDRPDSHALETAGSVTHPAATEQLKKYWSHGKGALKIAWGTPGDFARCETELGKYLPPNEVKGYCAERHHDALGIWPSTHAARDRAKAAEASDTSTTGVLMGADAADTVAEADAEKPPAAPSDDAAYADPGYQADKKKRYPLDTPEHIAAAAFLIGNKDNAAKYSAEDLAKVRAAIAAAKKKHAGNVSASEAMIGGSFAYADIIGKVKDALRARMRTSGVPGWVTVTDLTDSDVVYSAYGDGPSGEDALWQCGYSLGDDGTVTLAPTATPVVRTYAPAPGGTPQDDDSDDGGSPDGGTPVVAMSDAGEGFNPDEHRDDNGKWSGLSGKDKAKTVAKYAAATGVGAAAVGLAVHAGRSGPTLTMASALKPGDRLAGMQISKVVRVPESDHVRLVAGAASHVISMRHDQPVHVQAAGTEPRTPAEVGDLHRESLRRIEDAAGSAHAQDFPSGAVHELVGAGLVRHDGDLGTLRTTSAGRGVVNRQVRREIVHRESDEQPVDAGRAGEADASKAAGPVERVEQFADIRVIEAAGNAPDGGRVFRTQLIAYGDSANGRRYSEGVMRTAMPLYEGSSAYDHHRTPAELSTSTIRGLVGSYRNVSATRTGLEADLHLLPSATHAAEALDASLEAQAHGLPPLVGLSHDVAAHFRPLVDRGRHIQEATRIVRVNSADIVAVPAAGGRAVRSVAGGDETTPRDENQGDAVEASNWKKGDPPPWLADDDKKKSDGTEDDADAEDGESDGSDEGDPSDEKTRKPGNGGKPTRSKTMKESGKVDLAQVIQAVRSADPTERAALVEVLGGAVAESTPAGYAQESEDRTREAADLVYPADSRGARRLVKEMLSEARLPEASAPKVIAALGDRFTEADVERHIEGVKDALSIAELADMPGSPVAVVTQESRDKKVAALDRFFESDFANGYHSFKQAYIDITGYSPRSFTEDVSRMILRESMGITSGGYDSSISARESLNAGSWDQILGDSITRRMIAEYARPDLQDWRKIVSSIVPLTDFRTQRRTRFGGYGTLPIVNEGQPYNSLNSPSDEEVTYAPSKHGGVENITLEMIANDDVGAIARIPTKLGVAAAWTLYRFVFDILATNPTVWDGALLFNTGGSPDHKNTGTSALSQSTLSAARAAMRKQSSYGDSTDVLSIIPKTLIVPSDLEEIALQLTTSNVAVPATPAGPSDTPNIHKGLETIVVSYWTDSNDWRVIADPSMCPTIELGFLNGAQTPELFTQSDPTVGSMWNNDTLSYKIRHVYGGTVEEYRGMYAGLV